MEEEKEKKEEEEGVREKMKGGEGGKGDGEALILSPYVCMHETRRGGRGVPLVREIFVVWQERWMRERESLFSFLSIF